MVVVNTLRYHRKIQLKRITDISKGIDLLKGQRIRICIETLAQKKECCKKNFKFSENKFKPDSVMKVKSRLKKKKQSKSNKKSSERYCTRAIERS